jgi:hypothetical protein
MVVGMTNHEEAKLLADIKAGESNLARCYLELREKVTSNAGRIRTEISGECDLEKIHTSAESIIAELRT